MYYAGIGSRKTPKEVLDAFEYLGEELAKRGYKLRSGGAEGADSAFERGCDKVGGEKEIFLPWKGFNGNTSELYKYDKCDEAFEIAMKYHPYWDSLSKGGRALQARNSFQIMGLDLQTPSSFVICYTENGEGGGGTGQALRIAKDLGIKICDFGKIPKESTFDFAKTVLRAVDKGLFIPKLPALPYTIVAYEKDGDIYEEIGHFENMDMSVSKAEHLKALLEKGELRNASTGEPFDWIEIYKNYNTEQEELIWTSYERESEQEKG